MWVLVVVDVGFGGGGGNYFWVILLVTNWFVAEF